MADPNKTSTDPDFDPLIPVGSFDMSPREDFSATPRIHAIPALASLSKLGTASSAGALGANEDTPRTQYEKALLNEPLKTSRMPFPWEHDFSEEKYLLQIRSARNTQIDESVWDMAIDRSAHDGRSGAGRMSGVGSSVGGGSDTEEASNDDNPSPAGRRLNVREHSRNQREKRKALINSLEAEAKTLSEEIKRTVPGQKPKDLQITKVLCSRLNKERIKPHNKL